MQDECTETVVDKTMCKHDYTHGVHTYYYLTQYECMNHSVYVYMYYMVNAYKHRRVHIYWHHAMHEYMYCNMNTCEHRKAYTYLRHVKHVYMATKIDEYMHLNR